MAGFDSIIVLLGLLVFRIALNASDAATSSAVFF